MDLSAAWNVTHEDGMVMRVMRRERTEEWPLKTHIQVPFNLISALTKDSKGAAAGRVCAPRLLLSEEFCLASTENARKGWCVDCNNIRERQYFNRQPKTRDTHYSSGLTGKRLVLSTTLEGKKGKLWAALGFARLPFLDWPALSSAFSSTVPSWTFLGLPSAGLPLSQFLSIQRNLEITLSLQ